LSSSKDIITQQSRLSASRKALLEKWRRGKVTDVFTLQNIPRRQQQNHVPLSFNQQQLWILDQLFPGHPFYNAYIALHISGPLKVEFLERALRELVRRHESLRTIFQLQEDQPVQIIEASARFHLPIVDLSLLSPTQRDIEEKQIIHNETRYSFDLKTGPLFRVLLISKSNHEHMLVLTMHHIICDNLSVGVFSQEMIVLYEAFLSGGSSPLPDLPVQYADFSVWQRQHLQGELLSNRLAYWRQQLDGIVPLELPTDHARPPAQTFRGARQSFQLAPSLFARVKELSRREGETPFTLLMAAFKILLFRYTKQTDIAVGVPFANRSQPEVQGVIGYFVNTLVLRSNLSDDPTFSELSRRVGRSVQGALEYQDVPFELIVAELWPERDLSRSTLFQVLFNLQKVPVENLEVGDLKLKFLPFGNATAKFDLSFELFEGEQEINGVVEYSTDLFEQHTIQRMIESYLTLLEGIVADPYRRLSDLPLLSKKEQQHILVEWNDTYVSRNRNDCLPYLFEAQAECTPDAVALIYEHDYITYQQLNQRANQLAHYLQTFGVGSGVCVGICVERSLDMVVGLFGILKAGGVYVPLDPESPQERFVYMLQQAHVSVLVTQTRLRQEASYPLKSIVYLDTDQEVIAKESTTNPAHRVNADDMAYVIFTSGSTGQPKGAGVYHRGLMNLLHWFVSEFQISASDKTLMITSLSFDLTQKNIFAPLIAGGTVCLSSSRYHDVTVLSQSIAEKMITLLNCTPSMFYPFVDDADHDAFAKLRSLRYVFLGGEPISVQRLQKWIEYTDFQTEVVNTYGPTECSDVVAFYCLNDWKQILETSVPIGYPISNTQLLILDEKLHIVPPHLPGELHIAGECVGAGYVNDSLLTAEKFISNPFPEISGSLLYKTGDIACYREDGAIEYRGRLDQQVKVRGFRIELGEIESLLAHHPAVRECVVYTWEDEGRDKQLVAYIVGTDLLTLPSGAELRKYLQEKLPGYMIPTAFVMLDALPLTLSGKIDRRALPEPNREDYQSDEQIVDAHTPVEEMLAGIYCELLRRERVGIHESFFELGGHSLLATQVISRIRKMMQIEVPLRLLFEAPSVAELAQYVELRLRQERPVAPSLMSIAREQTMPLSFAQQRIWFLSQAASDSSAYNLPFAFRIQGQLNITILEKCIQEIVLRHESLRTTIVLKQGQPTQMISPHLPVKLQRADLQMVGRDEQTSEIARVINREMMQPFDLSQGPLWRSWLLRLGDEEHVLFFVLHHIIFDAWSVSIFLNELSVLYEAFSQELPSPLIPLPIQYVDFAHWQRSWLNGEVLDSLIAYWKKQLRGATALELPTDRPRPKVLNNRGASHLFALPVELSQELVALSRREGVTLFMTLLAAFQVLLSRYSRSQDIVVGTDIANRTLIETEQVVGFFVNLLVLRTQLSAQDTFRDLLRRVCVTVLNAYAHQDLPFDKLVEALRLERTMQQVPLVNVLFVMQNIPLSSLKPQGLVFSPVDIEAQTAKFDLSVFLEERDGRLVGYVGYRADLFNHSTILRMIKHFEILLQSIVTSLDASIEMLEMYSEEEKERQRSQEALFDETQQRKLRDAKRHGITRLP